MRNVIGSDGWAAMSDKQFVLLAVVLYQVEFCLCAKQS